MKISTIILAAGKGTRMRSKYPKVLHKIAGEPLAWHLIQAVKDFSDQKPIVVVGYQAEAVKESLGDSAQYVMQSEQLGTAHAVQQTEPQLKGKTDMVVVVLGDMPLITGQTLKKLTERQNGPAFLSSFRHCIPATRMHRKISVYLPWRKNFWIWQGWQQPRMLR